LWMNFNSKKKPLFLTTCHPWSIFHEALEQTLNMNNKFNATLLSNFGYKLKYERKLFIKNISTFLAKYFNHV
jgi:hypothetical protein